jgi:hypothetical protein
LLLGSLDVLFQLLANPSDTLGKPSILIGERMNVNWPPLVVRSWQGALYDRSPRNWIDWDHDPVQEAIISRRLHELRGLVVGQVAEIESLLLHIASETRDRYIGTLPVRQKRKGAGGALSDLRRLLPALTLGDELAGQLDKIGQVIDRRNRLVHGRIHIGFSRLGPQAPLEPVIYLLFENDGDDTLPTSDNDESENGPVSNGDSNDEENEMEDVELDEFALKKYLNEAYVAMDAAIDIWERVDEGLPERRFTKHW